MMVKETLTVPRPHRPLQRPPTPRSPRISVRSLKTRAPVRRMKWRMLRQQMVKQKRRTTHQPSHFRIVWKG